MSKIKHLQDVKTELAKLAQSAALAGDFEGYKAVRELLEGINKGDKSAIDKGFNVYNALILGA